jgi:hypothetical protein
MFVWQCWLGKPRRWDTPLPCVGVACYAFHGHALNCVSLFSSDDPYRTPYEAFHFWKWSPRDFRSQNDSSLPVGNESYRIGWNRCLISKSKKTIPLCLSPGLFDVTWYTESVLLGISNSTDYPTDGRWTNKLRKQECSGFEAFIAIYAPYGYSTLAHVDYRVSNLFTSGTGPIDYAAMNEQERFDMRALPHRLPTCQ